MKNVAFFFASLVLASSCSMTPNAKDLELTDRGVTLGIEACERQVATGETLDAALRMTANGRKYEVYNNRIPGAALTAPNWKLEGLVWAGINDGGACDVYQLSGSGVATRDAIVSSHLAKTDRKWTRMRVMAPRPGDARDGVCTTEGMPAGKSMGIIMTTTLNPGLTERRFVATVTSAPAADCTSRAL